MSSHAHPHHQCLKIPRVALHWFETTPAGPNHESSSYLTTPDPSDARIVFESQTGPIQGHTDLQDERTGVFLQLSIPVKLKGIFAHAPVHVHIHPSQIQSPAYTAGINKIDVPDAVRAKMPGKLACLSMMLSEPVNLIIPCNTPSPLRARSRASGQVLDALRSLGRATQLSIYMEDQEASRAHLQPLCALLAAGRGAPLPPYTETSRLFGGSGGCRWVDKFPSPPSLPPTVEEDHDTLPPRYDEIGPGPPMPPTSTKSEGQGTKRRRQRRCSTSSTSSNTSDALAPVDAGLQIKRPDLRASPPRPGPAPEPSAVQQRLAVLEVLVQAQSRQIEHLLADNRQQKERIRECEADIETVRLAAERAHARVEELELEMAVQRDDMERLDSDVQYCREQEDGILEALTSTVSDRITDAVTDAVTDRIAARGLSARNISFTIGDE